MEKQSQTREDTICSLAESLPHELLLPIFRESISSLHEYDPSVTQGPNSSWLRKCLRTKTSLPLVCRNWRAPATEILYSDIVLRRMGQVVALAETLRSWAAPVASETQDESGSSVGDLAVLIRRIRVDTLIVTSSCSDAVKNDLAYILNRSTRLTTFEFHPHGRYPLHDDTEQHPYGYLTAFSPAWMFRCVHTSRGDQPDPPNPVADAFRARLGSSIRELDLMFAEDIDRIWGCSEQIVHVQDFLRSAASTLVSLKLGAVRDDRFGALEDLFATPLVFPVLEELSLRQGDPSMTEYVNKAWVLPRLARFTLLLPWPFWPVFFLDAHGRRLQYLHLYPAEQDPLQYTYSPYAYSKLLEQCPELRHLILPGPPREPLAVRHQNLRHLDIWSSTCIVALHNDADEASTLFQPGAGATLRSTVLDAGKCSLPALRSVRQLVANCPESSTSGVYHLPANRHPDWPIVCPPDAIVLSNGAGAGADELRMRYVVFSSSWVVQTSWGVMSLCHRFFEKITSRAGAGRDDPADGDDDERAALGEDEDDLWDGMQPDERVLRAVLEEQGIEYSDAAADTDYCPLSEGEESESGSESGSEDFALEVTEVEDILASDLLVDRAPQLDRETVLEGFRRGLLAGERGTSDG